MLRATNKISKYDNLFTSGLYKQWLVELVILGVFNPPYLNNVFYGTMLNITYVYDYSSLLTYLIIMKSYLIIRVYTYYSYWTSDLAKSVCKKYKLEVGIQFAIKAELMKRPYIMLTIMMVISLCILGYGIKTFELGVWNTNYDISTYKIGTPFASLQNCFWLIIITMTTVGYGDIYPKSHLGRFIAVIACIIVRLQSL